jgi:hypothetical protein
MLSVDTMKYFTIIIILHSLSLTQDDVRVAPEKISNRVQVIVSGNHPDAINNESTIIFDNSKNIDLRSNNRPIKNTVPPSDTEEELFLPNEVMPTLSVEEFMTVDLIDIKPEMKQKSKIISDDYVKSFSVVKTAPTYDGSQEQNLLLMKALSIKPGWSNNAKWSDGTDVDDYSIVDWIKYGKGKAVGISSNDASKEARSYLYDKYVKSK